MKNPLMASLCFVVVFCGIGCISTKPTKSGLMRAPAMESVNAAELRLTARSLASPFGGIIEGTSDLVLANTSDPDTRYGVLRWKTEVIPAMHVALFKEDPLAALIDAGALVEQMDAYFVSGPGAKTLDEEQIAVFRRGIDAMGSHIRNVLIDAGVPEEVVADFWSSIKDWARENPVEFTFAMRPSTTPLLARFVSQTGGGIGDAVGGMQDQLSDLAARVDLYAEYLPRQVRWQSQLAAEEILKDQVVERTIDQIGGGVPVTIASLPIDIATERAIILETLRREGLLVGKWVESETDEALRYVTAERIEVLAAVRAERLAVLGGVAAERKIILEVLTSERRMALEELDELVKATFRDAAIEAVDHVFLRFVQVLAVLLPVTFLGCLFLVWMLRRGRS